MSSCDVIAESDILQKLDSAVEPQNDRSVILIVQIFPCKKSIRFLQTVQEGLRGYAACFHKIIYV